MKNLGPIIIGVIIGALLTYFFCPRAADTDEMPTIVTEQKPEVKAPKDTISVKEATRLFKNWQRNNKTEIDPTIEVEGSRKKTTNVAWSLKDVRAYLDFAEARADSLGFTMTGIRVYEANYGKNPDPALKNRNTLFIVPTGGKKLSKASVVNFSTLIDGNLPIPPMNHGTGGGGSYP